MPRELLRTLDADVRRLLDAGAGTASSDEGPRRRAEALRELSRKVPALGQIAAAVERVTEAAPAQATGPFLDLLGLVRQVRSSLTALGREGTLEELEASGPWATAGPSRDVQYLRDVMKSSGQKTVDILEDAEELVIGDLRLLQPLLALWEKADGELDTLLVERVLPQVGLTILPQLWQELCRDRRKSAWRLLLICRSNPVVGLELCQLALAEDDLMLREGALSAIGQVQAGATFIIPALLSGLRDPARSDRAMYARALGKIGSAARDAVPALCAALNDESPYVRIAAAEALGQIRSAAALPALIAAKKESTSPQLGEAVERAIARIQRSS
jgi:hypothetical protein